MSGGIWVVVVNGDYYFVGGVYREGRRSGKSNIYDERTPAQT